MKIEQLVPNQEFEYKGVNFKALEGARCNACAFKAIPCSFIPCFNGSMKHPKQKYDLIFIEIPKTK
jgi:hypothetical protein